MKWFLGLVFSALLATSAMANVSVPNGAKLLEPATVRVMNGSSFICTAFHIGKKMYLTAAHCIKSPSLRLDTPGSYLYPSSITIGWDNTRKGRDDWAIIRTQTEDDRVGYLELGCGEELYLGMPIAYGGYPYPVNFVYSTGHVSSMTGIERWSRSGAEYLVDVQAGPGASGSAVISLDTGKVVGILTEGVMGGHRQFFLVGIESIDSLDLCEFINKRIERSGQEVIDTYDYE